MDINKIKMKVKGKITHVSDIETFDSGSKKRVFVIDTGEKYDNILAFDFFKSADHSKYVEEFNHKPGDVVEVEFNIKSKEYNGKYYTNLNAWKVDALGATTEPTAENMSDDTDDDPLPF